MAMKRLSPLAGLCVAILMTACMEPTPPPAAVSPTDSPAKPAQVASRPSPPANLPGEGPLFDGRTMQGWRELRENAFAQPGRVYVQDGRIVLERGSLQTGIGWDGPFPTENYEVTLEAMRLEGGDFFCGMTFPVGSEFCTLILGGWGGGVVGLSNVDFQNASENVTTRGMTFENNRWYAIRLRVTTANISVWIDGKQVIDLPRENHHFNVWWEQEPARPFGFATWDTAGALRAITLQRLTS